MISIITITFNNYEELIETLNSIKNVNNIQSIVVNGGSCEKTKKFLETYTGITLSEKDRGISDAFNKGIKLSTGDALMFLNSGDKLIDSTYLDDVNNLLKINPEISLFYSDIIYNDSILGPRRIKVKEFQNENVAHHGMPYPHQSMIIRKVAFDKVGGFSLDLKIAMDFDLILRMMKAGFTKKRYIAKASVEMDGGGISSTHELACIRENQMLLKKHGYYSLKNAIRINTSIFIQQLKKNSTVKLILKKISIRLQ